jgi:UDP-N-acetylmuramoyl-tripeptide--D-alanyl-D-alanine ligase
MKSILNPKKAGKALLCTILEAQVVRLRAKHTFKLIAVAGSVGKTSTKLAIAQTLAAKGNVLYQKGNYNDRLTVPLVIFNQTLPGLFNLWAWAKIILAASRTIKNTYPYDYVVVELGTDRIGHIAEFAYLKPDITVVTAVMPEHMEFFGSLDAVAAEELAVFDYSKDVLVNIDDTPPEYLAGKTYKSYGFSETANFHISNWQSKNLQGSSVTLHLPNSKKVKVSSPIIGKQGAKISVAAASVAHELQFSEQEIAKSVENVRPFAGRLQLLPGLNNSTIIDDSYNASPVAVKAGLDILYAADAPQRIAILGSMNQMGEYSGEAHREVGEYCDSGKLDLVVTIGADAQKYLVPAANKAGCKVESFASPYEAGQFVKERLQSGAVVLVEGSESGIFAEESIKALLENSDDRSKLVRQSNYWMSIKRRQFPQT